jgi:SAM-dependent methyltransferase
VIDCEDTLKSNETQVETISTSPTIKTVQCTKYKGYKYQVGKYLVPDSPLAHKLLGDQCGIEIGPSACNPFNLNTIHVGLTEEMDPEDFQLYKDGQIEFCGDYAKIDVPGDTMNLSNFRTSSVPFILHSHVWEHVPNPLRALEEWARVVEHSGFIFIMVPDRCALSTDCARPVTTMADLLHYYEINATIEDFSDPETGRLFGKRGNDDYRRGHLIIFTSDLLIQIMLWFNTRYYQHYVTLRLISFLEVDDKHGNGHQITWQVIKGEQRPREEIAMLLP